MTTLSYRYSIGLSEHTRQICSADYYIVFSQRASLIPQQVGRNASVVLLNYRATFVANVNSSYSHQKKEEIVLACSDNM